MKLSYYGIKSLSSAEVIMIMKCQVSVYSLLQSNGSTNKKSKNLCGGEKNKVLIQQPVLEHETNLTPPIQAPHFMWLHIIMSVWDEAYIHCQPLDKLHSSTNMILLMFLSTVIDI